MDTVLSWWGLQLGGGDRPETLCVVLKCYEGKVLVSNVTGFEGEMRLAGGLGPLLVSLSPRLRSLGSYLPRTVAILMYLKQIF